MSASVVWNIFVFIIWIVVFAYIIWNWSILTGTQQVCGVILLILLLFCFDYNTKPPTRSITIVQPNDVSLSGPSSRTIRRAFAIGSDAPTGGVAKQSVAYVVDGPAIAPTGVMSLRVDVDAVECTNATETLCPGDFHYSRNLRFQEKPADEDTSIDTQFGMTKVATYTSAMGSTVNIYQSNKIRQFAVEVLAGSNDLTGTVSVTMVSDHGFDTWTMRQV